MLVHLRISPSLFCPVEDVGNQILDDGRIQLVLNAVSVSLRRDEPGISQHGEMTGHGWPCARKFLGNLAGAERAVSQHLNDLPSCRIGGRLEYGVRSCVATKSHGW